MFKLVPGPSLTGVLRMRRCRVWQLGWTGPWMTERLRVGCELGGRCATGQVQVHVLYVVHIAMLWVLCVTYCRRSAIAGAFDGGIVWGWPAGQKDFEVEWRGPRQPVCLALHLARAVGLVASSVRNTPVDPCREAR